MESIEKRTLTTDGGVFSRAAALAHGENVFSDAVATMNAGEGGAFAKAVGIMNAPGREALPGSLEGRDHGVVTGVPAAASPALDAGAVAVARKAADAAQRVHRTGPYAP